MSEIFGGISESLQESARREEALKMAVMQKTQLESQTQLVETVEVVDSKTALQNFAYKRGITIETEKGINGEVSGFQREMRENYGITLDADLANQLRIGSESTVRLKIALIRVLILALLDKRVPVDTGRITFSNNSNSPDVYYDGRLVCVLTDGNSTRLPHYDDGGLILINTGSGNIEINAGDDIDLTRLTIYNIGDGNVIITAGDDIKIY